MRFTFISDSVETQKESWIIDDFYINNRGNCTGIGDPKEIFNSYLPNPFSTNTTLAFEHDYLIKEGRFRLYDKIGRLIRKLEIKGMRKMTLEKQDMEAGIYYYQVMDGRKLLTYGKLIAE